MSDCSDTESCGDAAEHGAGRRRRLMLVWNDSQSELHPNDGRVASERREVHAGSQFVRTVASRVGFVDESGTVPRQLRHQQWSAFNVPLMWAAASGTRSHVAVVGSTSKTFATRSRSLSVKAANLLPRATTGGSLSTETLLLTLPCTWGRGTSLSSSTWDGVWWSRLCLRLVSTYAVEPLLV